MTSPLTSLRARRRVLVPRFVAALFPTGRAGPATSRHQRVWFRPRRGPQAEDESNHQLVPVRLSYTLEELGVAKPVGDGGYLESDAKVTTGLAKSSPTGAGA